MAAPKSNRLYPGDNAPSLARRSPAPEEEHGWFVVCVDACSYGRMGLHSALKHLSIIAGRKCIIGVSTLEEALQVTRPHALISQNMGYLVVRLPSLVREALIVMLQLSEIMQHATVHYHQIVVLSPYDVTGVQRLVTVMGMTSVSIVDARLSLSALSSAALFTPKAWMVEGGRLSQVLTTHERSSLRQTLEFRSIARQARVREVSVKTVYNQRLSALMKLGVQDIRSLLSLLTSVNKG